MLSAERRYSGHFADNNASKILQEFVKFEEIVTMIRILQNVNKDASK